jgi:hypothetical protein
MVHVVDHSCNFSTWEAEARGSSVPGQTGIQRELNLSQRAIKESLDEYNWEFNRTKFNINTSH